MASQKGEVDRRCVSIATFAVVEGQSRQLTSAITHQLDQSAHPK